MKQLRMNVIATDLGGCAAALREVEAHLDRGEVAAEGDGWSYTCADIDDLAQATAATVDAEETEVRLALRSLAAEARDALPTSSVLLIDDSDQGDWATLTAVYDADGTQLESDELDDASYDYTMHLYTHRAYLLTPHLVDAAEHAPSRYNPLRMTLSIDSILTEVNR